MADPECAAEQAEELVALSEIFGRDCRVHCEDAGAIAFAVDVEVDLGLGEGAFVRLLCEVGADEFEEQGPAEAEEAPPCAASVSELVERRLYGAPREAASPARPVLQRSESASTARAEASVRHLPPITLQVSFPPEGYPTGEAAPDFSLSCEWLGASQLARLCEALDARAAEMAGMPVVFVWTELLKAESAGLLGLADTVVLAASESEDVRAMGAGSDPMRTMMLLLEYDQHVELELWRQQVHTCGICFSEKAGSQFVHTGSCDHAFCSECMGEMASVHVREGSIVELKCPRPDCRAEIGAGMLSRVLDQGLYERWVRLKSQQILTAELKNVVFCPRCEEDGEDQPCLAPEPAEEDSREAPVARCRRCDFMFCGSCRGVAHASLEDCVPEEARMMQMAMRKAERQPKTTYERRQQQRLMEGKTWVEVKPGDALPEVDIVGVVVRDLDPIAAGDEIKLVATGTKESHTVLWRRGENALTQLEAALQVPPPLAIKFSKSAAGSADHLRKKKMLEELMTLRAIKQDSQGCPNCKVRISRSQGCNHMTCTSCGTHFCYRCGVQMPASNPYSHFSAAGCPTFDTSEVRRMVVEEQAGGENRELQELRRQFGRQEELFAMFAQGRQNERPARQRRVGDTQCPTCRQWNGRAGGLNAARCHACRTPYCHRCGKRVVGVVSKHFQGEGACPQHGD